MHSILLFPLGSYLLSVTIGFCVQVREKEDFCRVFSRRGKTAREEEKFATAIFDPSESELRERGKGMTGRKFKFLVFLDINLEQSKLRLSSLITFLSFFCLLAFKSPLMLEISKKGERRTQPLITDKSEKRALRLD